jgi:hypothetical protein
MGGFVTCACPKHAPSNVSITITQGQEKIAKAFLFEFTGSSKVSFVLPSVANLRGGTILTLQGSDMIVGASIECHFGDESEHGSVHSATMASCSTPRLLRAGKHEMSVSQNGELLVSSLSILFINDVELRGVKPSVGTTGGGTFVTLAFPGAPDCDRQVQFGGFSAPVILRDSDSVSVLTPASKFSGLVQLLIMCGEHPVAPSGGFYRYVPGNTAVSVSPSRGPVHGGMVATLYGRNFEHDVV